MTKIILILLFIWNGDLKLERSSHRDLDACIEAGNKRIEEQQKDPRFDRGLFADCITLRVQEANADDRPGLAS